MTRKQERREVLAANLNPINFKCGGCGKVQPFDEENPLVCEDCGYGKVEDATSTD